MSLKESNEITVKIKCELNEFYKIVKEKGFKIIDKFSWMKLKLRIKKCL